MQLDTDDAWEIVIEFKNTEFFYGVSINSYIPVDLN